MARPHTPQQVFDQFDPEFRLVTVMAQAAATSAGSTHINHEHLLMGLLADPAGSAGRLLSAVNVDADALSNHLRDRVGAPNPIEERPLLGKDSARAIRAAQRHASRTSDFIGPAHLLLGLTNPFSGWAGKTLKKAGVTRSALRNAHHHGLADHAPGLDGATVDWVWDYLPQTSRHMRAGEQAQAGGDLPAAIASYEQALDSAKEAGLIPGGVGDVYPKLIQANLLAGEVDRAFEWLDEADDFLDAYEFHRGSLDDLPHTEGFAGLIRHLEDAAAAHIQDLRLQLLKDRANLHLGRDEFDRVKDTALMLITVAEALEHPSGLAAGRHLLGTALTFTGEDDDAAERHLLESREPSQFMEPVDMAARTYALALLAGLRGDHGRATELAEEAEVRFADLGLQRSVAVARLARAEAELALSGALPPTLVEETARIDPTGKAELHAWALRLQAAAARRDDPEQARRSIEQAVAMSREHEHRLLLLRCLLEQGRIMAGLGSRRQAREAFGEALELSRQLGVRFTDEARRELEAVTDG